MCTYVNKAVSNVTIMKEYYHQLGSGQWHSSETSVVPGVPFLPQVCGFWLFVLSLSVGNKPPLNYNVNLQ